MADGSGEETIEREDYAHLLDDDLREGDAGGGAETAADPAGVDSEIGAANAETPDATTDSSGQSTDDGGWLPSLPSAGSLLDKVFSPKQYLGRAVVLAALSVAAGLVPFVNGVIATSLGVLVGAFLLGLVSGQRRFTETALAGATAGVVLIFVSNVGLVVVSGDATRIAAVGGGIGAILSLIGVYFGRDLRKGLTRDL